jgi:hypothetical protein
LPIRKPQPRRGALAARIAGDGADPALQALALRIAEAQVDLCRVRHVRHRLFDRKSDTPATDGENGQAGLCNGSLSSLRNAAESSPRSTVTSGVPFLAASPRSRLRCRARSRSWRNNAGSLRRRSILAERTRRVEDESVLTKRTRAMDQRARSREPPSPCGLRRDSLRGFAPSMRGWLAEP